MKKPGHVLLPQRPAKEWRRWRSQRNQDKSERELLLVPPNHIPSDAKYTEHKEEMREVLSPKYSSSHPEQVRTHSVFMISSKAHLSQCSTEGGIMSLKFKAEESPTCLHTSLPVLPAYQSALYQRPAILGTCCPSLGILGVPFSTQAIVSVSHP